MALDQTWACYAGVADARIHLCGFVDKVCSPGVGVAWAAGGVLYPLRAPLAVGGLGDVIAFEWTGLPPPTPKPPRTDWDKFKAFVERCMEQQGEAELIQSQAYMALGQTVDKTLGRMITTHRDDGVGVAIDVLCIALSLALLPTGIGALGLMGLIAGAGLLYMDGNAYAMEMAGNDDGAEAYKKKTEGLRIVATLMTLPDVAYGGFKAVKELQEIRELRAGDRITAATASRLGGRTNNAQRAQRYAQIAERANLRAQIRTQQVMASVKLEVTPRLGGLGSLGLLVREEVSSDQSELHTFMSRLRIHAAAVHR